PPDLQGGGRGRSGRRPDTANVSATSSTSATASAETRPSTKQSPSTSAPAAGGQRADKGGAGTGSDSGQRNFSRQGGFGSGGGGFGGGGFGGGGFGGRGGEGGGDRQARMLERFKSMSPDEQKQFIERIKGRGGDVS